MPSRITLLAVGLLALATPPAAADPPVASYIFPAGGRRGTTVEVRVGGLNLHSKASFEVVGPGVEASREIRRIETTWFEGPPVPLPDSQQAEDYPKDYAGRVTLAAGAPLGPRAWRVWTAEGASGSLPFIVGDLPELVEREVDGEPAPVSVVLPVTVNGRIFPREDVDLWTFRLRRGEVLTATLDAGRLGSPLDPWLEALGPDGRRIAGADPAPGCDTRLAFAADRDGTYTVKLHDVGAKGGQSFVYRLTLTTGPSVARVFPLGGRRGTVQAVHLDGLGVPEASEAVTLTTEGAGDGPRLSVVRLACGATAAVEVDDLPESLEGEPNDDPARAVRLAVPGVGNGRVGRAGDADVWAVALRRGVSYRIDVRAVRLGSRLDPVLTVTDPGGRELGRAEGSPAQGGDAVLSFRAPADGDYRLRVRDRFRSRGGPAWAYRLRVDESPAPDVRLALAADTLTVPRGGSARLRVEADRIGGFSGPVAVEVDGLPPGVAPVWAVIGPAEASTELTFKAAPDAPIRSARLTVRGTADVGGEKRERIATRRGSSANAEVGSVRLAVAVPVPFRIEGPIDFGWAPRGSVRHRHYRIVRNGYAGPLEVRLADRQARHLQGVTGPVVIVPAGTDEFDYAVTLPPWMEIGRTSRTVVMATGVVREPDGTPHEVSYSTPRNELQVVAVIGPGRIGLEAGRTSVAVAPGRTEEVPFRIARGPGVTGPVRVGLGPSATALGLVAEPTVVGVGRTEGRLRVGCGQSLACDRSARVTLRATTEGDGGPLSAETTLAVVREPSGRGD